MMSDMTLVKLESMMVTSLVAKQVNKGLNSGTTSANYA